MNVFMKDYLYAIFISILVISILFNLGFIVNKYKYAKVLGSIILIHKIIEICYMIFIEKYTILTNFSLIINFILLISVIYLFSNNKLLFNISYHLIYIILIKILFTIPKYRTNIYLYIVTLGYFLIILAIIYGTFFLRHKVYFVGYVISIISFIILTILSGMINKVLHTNMMYTNGYITNQLSFIRFNIYLIILMIANIVGISFMYIVKKN